MPYGLNSVGRRFAKRCLRRPIANEDKFFIVSSEGLNMATGIKDQDPLRGFQRYFWKATPA